MANRKKADAFNLDDKTDIKKLDYSQYAYVRDGSDDERMANDYEDEYDDTYDENTGVVEKMEPDRIAIKYRLLALCSHVTMATR